MTEKAKQLGSEAAFATEGVMAHNEQFLYGSFGLNKREYFAGLAMQSLSDGEVCYDIAAKDAVGYADALLEELSKQS
ncbi:MAG: hypothetical protein FWC39_10635 [Bacteroidetes bacterium]|nr:hypothetical protein [Bacteroidota bacterium]